MVLELKRKMQLIACDSEVQGTTEIAGIKKCFNVTHLFVSQLKMFSWVMFFCPPFMYRRCCQISWPCACIRFHTCHSKFTTADIIDLLCYGGITASDQRHM